MSSELHLHLLQDYISAVERVLLLRGGASPKQRAALKSQGATLLAQAKAARQRAVKGVGAHAAAAAERAANQPFQVTWRSTGERATLAGWQALSKFTGLQRSSLRVMLSRGRGQFTRTVMNRRGEPDLVEIRRLPLAKVNPA